MEIKFVNAADLTESESAALENELAEQTTLGQVLAWAGSQLKKDCRPPVVAGTVQQDEYTIDVIVPFRDWFLAFDTN